MKFLNKRHSKALLEQKSLPSSMLQEHVLVDFNNKIRITTKQISKLDLANLDIKSIGLPIDKLD